MKNSGGAKVLKALGAGLGTLLTLTLTSTAFFRWDLSGHGPLLSNRFGFRAFASSLPQHAEWLAAFGALSALTLFLRAVQWGFTLPKAVPFKERMHLVNLGALVHNVLPGKLGDVTRAFLLARTQQLSFLSSLGSVAMCKLLEFAALMAVVSASCLGPLRGMASQFRRPLEMGVGLCALGVLGTLLLARYAGPLSRRFEATDRCPRLRVVLHELDEGLGTARSARGLILALVVSLGPVLAPALGYGLGLRGLGIEGGLWAGPLLLGAIAVGQSVLVVPAGMGLYYFVTSYTARTLGATPDQAAAFATLTHLSTLLVQAGMGLTSLWLRKLKWADLREDRLAAALASGAAP